MRRALPAGLLLMLLIGLVSFAEQSPAYALAPAILPQTVADEPAPDPADAPLESEEATGSPDLQVLLMPAWTGPGNPVWVTAMVRNIGTGPSAGHTLTFSPQEGSDREVTVDGDCVPGSNGGFRCTGGPLLPWESSFTTFRFSPPGAIESWPPFWTATVTGEDSEPSTEDNRMVFELPDATFVRFETDIKTRVVDSNDDGSATPGEPMEIYVYFVNTSEYELEEVLVAVTGTVRDHLRLPQSIAPGEETTVRFDAEVPDLGANASSGVEADVMGRAVGATVRASSGTLMLLGPSATPNPEGPDGEQSAPVKYEVIGAPAETLDEERVPEPAPDDVSLAASAAEPRSPAVSPDLPEEPAPQPPQHTGAKPVAAATAESEPARAHPPVAAPAPSPQPQSAGLSITGSDPLRGTLLTIQLLVALGVVFVQIGLTRQRSATRAGDRR